jgi:hypothetical protein
MPKRSDRDRLSELESRQRKLAEQIETARAAIRARYAEIVKELELESLGEKEFRELLMLSIRLGAGPALMLLRAAVKTPPASRKATALPANPIQASV